MGDSGKTMVETGQNLFVYGTLLAVSEHPFGQRLQAAAKRVGAGSIRGRLYIVSEVDAHGQNHYPAAIPCADPGERVWGEVWRVTDETIWPEFDAYEACSPEWPEPHEFLLRAVPVTMETGETLWARSYLYGWDLSGARHVPSGRFAERMPDAR